MFGITHLAQPAVAAPLTKLQPRGRCMRHYVAADGFGRRPKGHAVHTRHNLVRYHDSHTKLVREPLQLAQEGTEQLLAVGQLPAPDELAAEQRGRTIDDHQRKPDSQGGEARRGQREAAAMRSGCSCQYHDG